MIILDCISLVDFGDKLIKGNNELKGVGRGQVLSPLLFLPPVELTGTGTTWYKLKGEVKIK